MMKEEIRIGYYLLRTLWFIKKVTQGTWNNLVFWLTNKCISIKINTNLLIEEEYQRKNFNKIKGVLEEIPCKNFETHRNYININLKNSDNMFRINYFPLESTDVSGKEKSEINIELVNIKKLGFRDLTKSDALVRDLEILIDRINYCNFKIINSYKTINLLIDMENSKNIQNLTFNFPNGDVEITTKDNSLMIHSLLISDMVKNIKKSIRYWNSIR